MSNAHPTELGLVTYHRAKSGQVTSLGRFAYAVEHESTQPCPCAASINGFFFDDRKELVEPIIMIADDLDKLKMGLRSSDRRIVSREGLVKHEYTMHWRLSDFTSGHVVEIHDASKTIMQNVAGFATGFLPASGAAGAIKEFGGAAVDFMEGSGLKEKGTDFFKRKTASKKKIGLIVYPFKWPKSHDLGVYEITIKDLAAKVFGGRVG